MNTIKQPESELSVETAGQENENLLEHFAAMNTPHSRQKIRCIATIEIVIRCTSRASGYACTIVPFRIADPGQSYYAVFPVFVFTSRSVRFQRRACSPVRMSPTFPRRDSDAPSIAGYMLISACNIALPPVSNIMQCVGKKCDQPCVGCHSMRPAS